MLNRRDAGFWAGVHQQPRATTQHRAPIDDTTRRVFEEGKSLCHSMGYLSVQPRRFVEPTQTSLHGGYCPAVNKTLLGNADFDHRISILAG